MREEDNMNTYSVAAQLKAAGADKFISDFKNASKSVQGFVKDNEKAFESMRKVGKVAMAGGLAIGAGLGFAVKTAATFEAAMSEVGAISGASAKDMKLLEATAREWGATTSFSATEAAEGLKYMALAGWDVDQMMGGIGPILHLAEAGALDLGRASDLVTDSMAGLGLEVNDLDGYLDKVAQTSRRSNTDIDALMEAFVIAGGTFNRLNVPLEESNAFLGILANRGFKGAQAGTAVNAIMTRLTASTGPAAEALKEIGVSAFDSEGNFRGMEVVMKDVEKALGSMDDEQRAHYQTQIAGLNHGKTFNAMLDGLGDEYDDLKDSIVNSDGALQEMRDTMKDNLQGQLENLWSAIEDIAISIGNALMPAVKLAVRFLQMLADTFNGLSETSKTIIAIFLAISAVVLTLGGAFLILVGSLPFIISGLGHLKNVLNLARTAMLGLNAAFLLNPIVLVVAAIVAAAALIYVYWEPIKNFFINLWDSIKQGAMNLWNAVLSRWGAEIEALKQLVLGIVDHYVNVWTSIYEFIQPIIQSIVDFVMNIWTTLVDWWNDSQDGFLDKAITLWQGINNAISTAISTIVEFVKEIWGGLVEWWNEHGQMIQDAAMNVWTFISTIITTVVMAIWTVISTVFEIIRTIILTVFDAIFAAVEFVWPYILETITFVIDAIWAIMQFIWPLIQFLIVDTWNAIVNVIQGAIDIILGIVQFFAALFTGDWEAMWDATKQIFSGALKLVWGLINLWFVGKILKGVKAFAKGFGNIIKGLWSSVKSLFTSGVNVARNVVTTGFNFIRNIISTVMNVVRNIISTVWNAIRSVITSVVNAVRSVISSVFNAIRSTISGVMNSIRSTISSVWNAIRSVISSVVNSIRSTISNIFNSLRGIVSGAMSRVRSAVSNGIKGALNVVTNMGSAFKNAGSKIVSMIADGIKAAASKVTAAAENLMGKVRNLLPFSPAKDGPLTDLHKLNFGGTIADSIKRGKSLAIGAMENMMASMREVGEPNIVIGSSLTSPRRRTSDMYSEGVSAKQPAHINVSIGKRDFYGFVEDITEVQDRNNDLRRRFT